MIKKLLIQISITFTIISLYDMVMSTVKGQETVFYNDLWLRLSLITIGFGSFIVFRMFENLSLRMVQLIHFVFTSSLVVIILYAFHNFHLKDIISYIVIHFIILLVYEFHFRLLLKRHQKLIKKINQ